MNRLLRQQHLKAAIREADFVKNSKGEVGEVCTQASIFVSPSVMNILTLLFAYLLHVLLPDFESILFELSFSKQMSLTKSQETRKCFEVDFAFEFHFLKQKNCAGVFLIYPLLLKQPDAFS